MTMTMHPPLAEATNEAEALERDLANLRDALQEHERELTTARRAGQSPAKLATLGSRAASLRLLVADQLADLELARARVRAATFEAQRAAELDRARAAAAELERIRADITSAVRDLPAAVAEPVARIAAATMRWRELFDQHARGVAELRVIAANEAGTEPPTPTQAIADPDAWTAAACELEAAGVDPHAFRDHATADTWYEARVRQDGIGPAYRPRPFVVPLPELVAPLTTDPEHPAPQAWGIQDAPTLARLVAEAVLAGDLDGSARPVERSS